MSTRSALGAMATLVAAAAVALAGAPIASSAGTHECHGVPRCVSVRGPWVVVPAHGEAVFLLECPLRRGVAAGIDAATTSSDIRVTFDGLLGSPLAPGTTSGVFELFRARSESHHVGAFQPVLGCIPVRGASGRATTSARVAAGVPGAPFDLWQTTGAITPGGVKTVQRRCGKGERLVDGWSAVAFASTAPPSSSVLAGVQRKLTVGKRAVVVVARAAKKIPASARPEVQAGAVCGT